MPSFNSIKPRKRRLIAAALFATILLPAPQLGHAAGCSSVGTKSLAPDRKEPALRVTENTPVPSERAVAVEQAKRKLPLRNPADTTRPCVMPLSSLDGGT